MRPWYHSNGNLGDPTDYIKENYLYMYTYGTNMFIVNKKKAEGEVYFL